MLVVTANDASRPYGAPNPVFNGSIVGLQPGDNITASYSTAAGTNSPAGAYSIVPTLNDPDHKLVNYNVAITNGTLTVTPAPLTVTADAKTKRYGEPDPALSYQITSGSLTNGDSLTGSLLRAPGDDVGVYAIGQGTLTAGSNYVLTYVSAYLTITPASSTVALVASLNPSRPGSNVTFTATVLPVAPAKSTPTGSVQFYANDTPLGSLVVLTDGVANLSTADLPAGTNIVLAAYLGDGNFVGSTNSLAQVVSLNAETPSILSIRINSDTTVTVSFSGTPGKQWVVQACTDTATPVWENVSTNVADAEGRWTFTEAISTTSQRLYRAATP